MRTLLFTLAVGCFACGGSAQVRDVRVALPAADANSIDFVSSEQTIGPGEDKMFCSEVSYDGDDAAFTEVTSLQGKFGHHVILVSTSAPRGVGSNYDCTEMRDFLPLAIPANGWPPGHGSSLSHGTPVVLQMHYVNTGDQPLLVRDVVRLRKIPVAEVTTWVAPFALNHETFQVPAHDKATVTFDCLIPNEYKLLLIGGHMHENGVSFRVDFGLKADALEKLYEVTTWQAEYRDEPPVDLYLQNQRVIEKNTILRTTCAWQNDKATALQYPHEMCATFGLFAGTKDAFICRKSQ